MKAYIARDRDGVLYIYREQPERRCNLFWSEGLYGKLGLSNDPNYNPFQSTTEESASKLSPRAQRLRNIMNNPEEAEKVQTIVAQGEVKEQKVEQEDLLPFDE